LDLVFLGFLFFFVFLVLWGGDLFVWVDPLTGSINGLLMCVLRGWCLSQWFFCWVLLVWGGGFLVCCFCLIWVGDFLCCVCGLVYGSCVV